MCNPIKLVLHRQSAFGWKSDDPFGGFLGSILHRQEKKEKAFTASLNRL